MSTLPEHLGTERQVILVVSPGLEPSRPHVAANLAAIYAEANQRVIVISTSDIETNRKRHATPVTAPITTDSVRAALEPSRLGLVSRLPLAGFIGTSGQLVTRAPDVLRSARRLADAVIVEVPPLLAVHHAEALAHSADVVLVVGECGWTTFHDARSAGELLRRIDAPVLGVVLTNVQLNQRDIRQTASRPPVSFGAEEPEPAPLVSGEALPTTTTTTTSHT